MTANAVPAADRLSQRAHLPSPLGERTLSQQSSVLTQHLNSREDAVVLPGSIGPKTDTAELHVLPAALREEPRWHPILYPPPDSKYRPTTLAK